MVEGAGSRARRLGNLDDQLRSTRLSATQRDACSGKQPTPTGDGTTMGGEADGGGRGRGDGEGLSQWSMRVLSAGRELSRKLFILFPKNSIFFFHIR